jgi:hypothetical protein
MEIVCEIEEPFATLHFGMPLTSVPHGANKYNSTIDWNQPHLSSSLTL